MFPTNAFESKESCDGGCCTRRRMAALTISCARSHRRPVDGWRHPDGADRLWSGVRRAPDGPLLHHADAHPETGSGRALALQGTSSARAGAAGRVNVGPSQAVQRGGAMPNRRCSPSRCFLVCSQAVELWQSSPAPAWLCLWQPQRGSTPAALVAATLRHRSAPARPHPPPRRSDRRGEPSGPAPAHPALALPSPRPRARGLPSPCSSTGLDAGSSGIPARPPAAPLLARVRRAAIAAHAFGRIATQAVEGYGRAMLPGPGCRAR